MEPLYPLLSARKLVEPIWGGGTLAAWLDLPEPRPSRLGETWEVFDTNSVTHGPLAGQTLASLVETYSAELVGTRTVAHYGADLPLLAKFLDANDRLSIQVHPDDVYAHAVEAHTGYHGKTEAWYILAAEPGATVTYGLNRPCSRDTFAAAVAAGTVEQLLYQLPVQAGDTVFVPAGTLHAINAGIMLFEIQQKSDLTYRVYDYNRRDAQTGQLRELHLAKALDVSTFAPAPRGVLTPLPLAADGERYLLVACTQFALERQQISSVMRHTTDPASFEVLTLIAGAGRLTWRNGGLDLQRGDSVLLPAALGDWAIEGALTLLRTYVPDLHALANEARMAGHAPERIAETILHD
jgi:mannose-6-phosphate isomerase